VEQNDPIINRDDQVLITGANGFIGARVVAALLRAGFTNLRCFARPSSNLARLHATLESSSGAQVEILQGNLLSREDCMKAANGAAVVFHLAAASDRSYPASFMNCVVTTRNLLDAVVRFGCLRRFVNVSSFAVYSNADVPRGGILDETCKLDSRILDRAEAYAFAKLKQEELLVNYSEIHNLPYVIVRPGAVYGPGAPHITGRVGIDTFGIFLHLGRSNQLPLTYVDNCAQAIMLAGTTLGVDGEAFNVVDDELPNSKQFLRAYKKHGKPFRSVDVPYWLFYGFSWMWEKYSTWSEGQLPPVFNRNRCVTYWKGNRYSNQKIKDRLGWKQEISFLEASRRYFEYARRTH
jgi:nucleoside-diphosphate-sugar epimerase